MDATEEEFARLEKGMRDMAQQMPASASEIALVGEAAGQLGIKTESLLSFTEVMIGLGEATTMSSDQAATELARLANITKMNQGDFDKLGSSIVALGNNFATTEGEITAMALRLAGAGSQIGMSEADILGLAAALSSVGIEAEMGGSALSRVMVRMQVASTTGLSKVQEMVDKTGISLRDMQLMAANAGMDFADLSQSLGMTKQELKNIINAGVDLENFSKIAGVTSEEFQKSFEQNAVGALGAFINGLGTAEEAGESAINMLQEMGITEIRLRDSLLRAGGANELFAESIRLSNEAWEENVALQNEVAQRYGTTESQLKMFKNQIVELGMQLGEILIPVLMDIVAAIQPWIQKFSELGEGTKKTILVIAGIAAAIGPVLIVIGKVVTAIGALMPIMSSLGPVIAALTGPIGWVVAGVVALIAIFTTLYKKNEEFRNFVNETWTQIKDTFTNVIKEIVTFAKPILEDMKDFFGEILGKIKEFWDENGEAIMTGIKLAFEFIVGFVKIQLAALQLVWKVAWEVIKAVVLVVWEYLKMFISNTIDIIAGVIDVAMKLIKGDWEGAWNSIKATVEKVWNNIMKFFKNLSLKDVGKNLIQGLIDGISSMISKVGDVVKSITDSIKNIFKKDLEINSPSKLTEQMGVWTGEGLVNGMKRTVQAVSQQASQLASAATPNISRSDYSANVNGSNGGSGSVINFEGFMSGAVFNVRSDHDIQAIAREIFNLQQQAVRGAGI